MTHENKYTIEVRKNTISVRGDVDKDDLWKINDHIIDILCTPEKNIISIHIEATVCEDLPPSFSQPLYFTPSHDTASSKFIYNPDGTTTEIEPTADNPSPPPMEPDPPWPPLNDYADQPSPCYFCGSGNLKRNYKKAYFIECLNCGVTGPRSSSSIEDGQKLWNDYYIAKGGNNDHN